MRKQQQRLRLNLLATLKPRHLRTATAPYSQHLQLPSNNGSAKSATRTSQARRRSSPGSQSTTSTCRYAATIVFFNGNSKIQKEKPMVHAKPKRHPPSQKILNDPVTGLLVSGPWSKKIRKTRTSTPAVDSATQLASKACNRSFTSPEDQPLWYERKGLCAPKHSDFCLQLRKTKQPLKVSKESIIDYKTFHRNAPHQVWNESPPSTTSNLVLEHEDEPERTLDCVPEGQQPKRAETVSKVPETSGLTTPKPAHKPAALCLSKPNGSPAKANPTYHAYSEDDLILKSLKESDRSDSEVETRSEAPKGRFWQTSSSASTASEEPKPNPSFWDSSSSFKYDSPKDQAEVLTNLEPLVR